MYKAPTILTAYNNGYIHKRQVSILGICSKDRPIKWYSNPIPKISIISTNIESFRVLSKLGKNRKVSLSDNKFSFNFVKTANVSLFKMSGRGDSLSE